MPMKPENEAMLIKALQAEIATSGIDAVKKVGATAYVDMIIDMPLPSNAPEEAFERIQDLKHNRKHGIEIISKVLRML